MPGQRLGFLAANQNLQAPGGADVGLQRAHDGFNRHLLAEDAGRHGGGQRIGKIGDGGAAGKQIELKQDGVRRQRSPLGAGRALDQGGDQLPGALDGLGGKRKLHVAGLESGRLRIGRPEEPGRDRRVGGRGQGELCDFAPGLLFGGGGALQAQHVAQQAGEGEQPGDEEYDQDSDRNLPAPRHQRAAPGAAASSASDCWNAAAARASASPSGCPIWLSAAESSATLETSMAMAGAATVRN